MDEDENAESRDAAKEELEEKGEAGRGDEEFRFNLESKNSVDFPKNDEYD